MASDPSLLVPRQSWSIPLISGGAVNVDAIPGAVTTIVGANGAGKSALAAHINGASPAMITRRIIAHRKLWFTHSGPEISSAQREQTAQNSQSFDRRPDSRYSDRLADSRTSITLFDLIGKINDQHRQIVEAQDGGASWEDAQGMVGERLLPTLNTILNGAGLFIQIETTDHQTFDARHADLDVTYPIYKMSDGEKSALLLAAEVLTAPQDGVVIIDEPERHLHRSISSRLIESVVAARPDCAFVILTHDLDLAAALGGYGSTFAALGVQWQDDNAVAWDLVDAKADGRLPESARRAILGGRTRILFIEGDQSSVDLRLYRILYPEWAPTPAGGCDSVIRSVTGLRASEDHHWLAAVGIVDGDGRDESERDSLFARGVVALPINEVESFYYLPEVVEAVAARQSATLGAEVDALATAAVGEAMSDLALPGTLERLSEKLARDEIARKFVDHLPKQVTEPDIEVSIPSPYSRILSEAQSHLAASNYGGLVRMMPIRDTGVRQKIAKTLGFASIAYFENAARVAISTLPVLRGKLLSEVGPLPQ